MSWVKELADFAKQLLTLESRVESNSKEIQAIRQDMKTLVEFSNKVASVVKHNQITANDRHKLLVAQLQNELLKLENQRLISTSSYQQPKELPTESES